MNTNRTPDDLRTPAMHLLVRVEAENGLDEADLADLTRSLRSELADLPAVEEVRPAAGGDVPAGAKSVEAFTIGALALAVLPVAVPEIIRFLKDWALRPGTAPVKLRFQSGDRSIEAEYDPRSLSAEDIVRLAAEMRAVVDR